MKRVSICVLLVVALGLVIGGSVFAQSAPEFKLGFKTLADQVSSAVGQAVENEHWGANGDSLQQTTTGLMVWRKADNWTAFTNGSRTWVNGPLGVMERGNEERFSWESPAAGPHAPPAAGKLRLHVIDVGQGDAILIQAPDGKTALVDGGSAGTGALSYLRSQGVERLDALILTHPHEDHVGGLAEVLRGILVSRVFTGGQSTTTLAYEQFLDAVAVSRSEYHEVKHGDLIQLGSLSLEVLNPVSNRSSDNLNNDSVVLRFSHGATSFLLAGDAEKEAEAGMLAQNVLALNADVLKVGHHGSRTASSRPFLSAVVPKSAIYSAASGNSYGHPHAETLAALASVGATTYGTDTQGTVVVESDGTGYTVSTSKQTSPKAPPVTSQTPPVAPSPPAVVALLAPTGVPTEQGSAIAIQVVSVTSPVRPGATATLVARTSPGSSCSIAVRYASGQSTAAGLVPKAADANGMVSWTWMVGTRTTPGTWPVTVTAGGSTVQTTFVVGQ
jgi:competence protein ComEC